MGAFRVAVGVGDPGGQRWETVEALVDTGATYTTLPAALLRRLGVRPHTRGQFLLADGTLVEREIGRTMIRLDGQEDMAPAVFGDEQTSPLLGAVTLEIFRLGVGPVARRPAPVPGLLMGHYRALHCLLTCGDGGPWNLTPCPFPTWEGVSGPPSPRRRGGRERGFRSGFAQVQGCSGG